MPMRERGLHGEQLVGPDQRLIAENPAEGLDASRRPVGQIRNGAFADAAVLAPGLAEQDGGRRVPVGDTVDIHGDKHSQ